MEKENREVPKYLLEKKNMTLSVVFITLFSILFLLIYSPFSSTTWFNLLRTKSLIHTVLFYIIAISILTMSKILMYNLQKRIVITKKLYVIWLFLELIAISISYASYTMAIVRPEKGVFIVIMGKALYCIATMLAIPYVIFAFYSVIRSQKEELQMLRHRRAQRGAGYNEKQLVNLCDNNKVTKMTISLDSLYYLESKENYVKIHYENRGEIQHYMIRCKTKDIEESLAGTTMIRCHRSFIINVTKIKLLKDYKVNNYVILKHPDIKPIPVSKTYYAEIIKAISTDEKIES
ncbi:MAG TPA: LytTR family DNA-binding domain-containing protein [Bacteroidaceae bacterium]|nr:LytTR family DNA-binding domain-containing protein [Bacteroidaceae bacterium]